MEEEQFLTRIKENQRPIVVDFWAPWCAPCRMIAPALERLSQEYEGQVDLWKVNADENPDLLRALGIYGIPTVIAFHNGQEISRQTGAGSQASLRGLFEAARSGEPTGKPGLSILDRLVRLAAGSALLYLAYLGGFAGVSLILVGLGGLVLFSAIYDRCPIWQAIAPRLQALLKGNSSSDSG